MAANTNGSGDSPSLELDTEPDMPERHVIDDAKYSHSRRLRAIHNAHDRTLEVRNAVEERLIGGAITEYHARRYYRSAVETFIMTVLPVFERDDIGLSTDYANAVELGEIVIRPPDDLVHFARANVSSIPPGGGVPQPIRHEVVGLRAIVDLPSPLTHRFAVAVQEGADDVQMYQREVREEIPRDVLDRAVQACADALDDAEMGLDIDTGRENNALGIDGKWPADADAILPHELYDLMTEGKISREEVYEIAGVDPNAEETDDTE